MALSKFRSLTLALSLLAPTAAYAWEEVPNNEPFMAIEDHNLQWFEPVEVDLDGELYERSGFFFGYEKLYWNFTGERTTIGDPNVVVLSEDIFPVNPQDEDNNNMAPEPYQVINGIQDAPPDATFGWGDRYEAGYTCDGRGWMIGVLAGPEAINQQLYGFQLQQTPTLIEPADGFPIPVFTELITGFNDETPFGWGSIHVNFRVPSDNFLKGFRDYHLVTQDVDDDLGDFSGGRWIVYHGPGGTGTDGQATDQIPDDIDEDGINGFAGIPIVDPEGNIIDVIFLTDFDDLYLFNIRFNSMIVRSSTQTDGVEVMRTHEIDNRHKMAKRQNNRFELAYGVRYLRLKDRFEWQGIGDILGYSFNDTVTDNNIVGPQVRLRWESQRGKWRLNLDGRAMLGWNINNSNMEGGLGFDLNPGGLNKPVIFQPTYFQYGRRDDQFAPVGEFRAEASYQLTSALELKVGYNFTFIDGISRSGQLVDYVLPDMGLLPGGDQEIFINGVNVGLELNH